jgi:hypothetical protein
MQPVTHWFGKLIIQYRRLYQPIDFIKLTLYGRKLALYCLSRKYNRNCNETNISQINKFFHRYRVYLLTFSFKLKKKCIAFITRRMSRHCLSFSIKTKQLINHFKNKLNILPCFNAKNRNHKSSRDFFISFILC